MGQIGVRTIDLPPGALLDSVLGNLNDTTVKVPVDDLIAALLAAGPLFEKLTTAEQASTPFGSRAALEAADVGDIEFVSVVHPPIPSYLARRVNYRKDTSGNGNSVTSNDGVVFSPAGVMTPEHWGVPATGDCTSALDAMFTYAQTLYSKNIHFQGRDYLYDGEGMRIIGSNWNITCDAGAAIYRTTDGPMIVLDMRPVAIRDVHIKELRYYSTLPVGSRDNTHGISFLGDPVGGDFGAERVFFMNPNGSSIKSLVFFGETTKLSHAGIGQLMTYNKVHTINPTTDQNSGGQGFPDHGVLWESGTGQHNSIIGGTLRTSDVAVKGGDGVNAIHDLTITGTHLMGKKGGVRFLGPTDPLKYRDNVSITGCQFDGATSGYTFDFENLSDFEVAACNSQNGVDYRLTNCTGPYRIEDNDRNIIMTGAFEAGSVAANSGSMTATRDSAVVGFFTTRTGSGAATHNIYCGGGIAGQDMNGNLVGGTELTINDDAVGIVTPPRVGGFLMLTVDGDTAVPSGQFAGFIIFDTGVSLGCGSAGHVGAQLDTVTVNLTGQTGTNGNVTVSAFDGDIIIENRSNQTRKFQLSFL